VSLVTLVTRPVKRLRADSADGGAGLPARSVRKCASAAPSIRRRPKEPDPGLRDDHVGTIIRSN
jgi:hypothetical protein